MAIWNSRPVSQTQLVTVEANLAAVTTTANAAIPSDTRPSTSGNVALLSGRPWGSNAGTTSFAKDTWRCHLTHMKTPWSVAGLGIITTIAASGGTGVLVFGSWVRGTNGRPENRLVDYVALGSIDLTQPAGTLVLVSAVTLPAGEYFIGCAWAGTASTPPTVSTHSGLSAGTDSATGNNGGYTMAASGLTMPNPFIPAAGTTGAPAILVKLV